ncbi:hypothetical protein TSUD_77820 [Trifolium subterraneum]|uniref:Uncharacterized protein n=1 Tax=Trifolium subterraneum TaxID=3900 RepID=A0A2Z6P3E4_TRISU|nr:hypothetical protein TSUD_77820 [Trifolium subterraneum]
MSETTTVTNNEPTINKEIIPTIHEQFAVTTKLVELKINNRDDLVVGDGDFTLSNVDSISQVDDKETKFVTTESVDEIVFAISKTHGKSAKTTTRFTLDSLIRSCSYFKKSFLNANISSPEKKVLPAVTAQQHLHITFELSDVSTHIFDPGGTLTVAVCSSAHRPQIQNFKSYGIGILFLTTAPSPSHHVFVSLLSLVWEPWDRGKISW